MRISKSGYTVSCCLFLGLLLSSGCGGSSVPVRSQFVEFTTEQKQQIEVDSRRPYRIQTEDVLQVAVSNQKELFQDGVIVLPDGAISLVGAGRLRVAGLTLAEADSSITKAFSREIRNPDVSVIVRETQGKQIFVLGEVNSPGLQKLPNGGLGIVGVIALAGGFTDDAAPEGAVLVRINHTGYMAQEIDLSYFGHVEAIGLAAVGLQAFDVVYVPRSRIGDFGYFSRTVLAGLVNITRMATDISYLSSGNIRGF